MDLLVERSISFFCNAIALYSKISSSPFIPELEWGIEVINICVDTGATFKYGVGNLVVTSV